MSWMDCIDRALAAKKITGKRADEARERYKNLYQNAINDGMAPLDAEDHAANLATSQIEAEKAQLKARQLKQMAWSIDNWHTMQAGGAAKLKVNAKAMIEGQIGATPGIISLNDHVTTARGRIEAFLSDMIDKYSPKVVGLVYPKAGLDNIVRELFKPGSTGDHAAEGLAKAWIKATDYGVHLYQMAGGVLNHLEEWRLPQHMGRVQLFKVGSQAVKVAGVDTNQFVADHLNWLDWNKMQYPNGARIDPDDRIRVLTEAYNTMKTGGDIRIKPGEFRRNGGGGVNNHRFLIYKDADSWLAAHSKYGDGSIYETMMRHVEGMSRRIGTANAFGPSPATGLEQVVSNMRRVAAEADIAAGAKRPGGVIPTTNRDEAQVAENYLRDAFQVKVRGMNAPENGSAAIAAGLASDARTLIMSAVLGSTYLYQGVQDFWTAALRYRLAGLPVMHAVKTYFSMFLPTMSQKEMTRTLQRAGFVNYAQGRIAQSYARMTGMEPQGSRLAQRISDTVMRASLTEWHAASGRFTTAAEFCGAFADWRAMPFDKVPAKRIFEAHGIDADDWDRMRATPVHNMSGHEFIFPDDHIGTTADGEETDMQVADKFMSMINQEAKLATIEAQVSSALTMKGTTRPGTLIGELSRSISMFKNFPLTVFNTHIRQALQMPTVPGKIGYMASVVLGLTLFGGIGVMLHDVAYGKNPQSLLDPEFWTRAVLASGGMGIIGDYIAGNLEHGKTLGETIGGPLLEEGSDLINLAGEAGKAVDGQKTHIARDLNRFGARWTPGSTIWWLRAPLRAMIWENLLKATDPQAAQVFRRRARFAEKNGQDYWWAPGETLPHEAPDLTSLVRK